jgi:hypothetical protein
MSWGVIEPVHGDRRFEQADAIVQASRRTGKRVRGQPLVWDLLLPSWLTQGGLSARDVERAMRDHVQALVGRYQHQVAQWDVVDEPLEDDGSLTPRGWDRARRLADVFDPAQGPPRPGLARPATIYTAAANDEGRGQRTRETVAPLAERLRITTDTTFGKGDEAGLVEHVIAHPGPALISWQHGEIPAIAKAFPSVTPTPPSEWPDDRFDVVWTFTRTGDGWHFAQVPELALPGDRADPIED